MRTRNYRIWAHLNKQEYNALRSHVKRSGLSQESYLRLIIAGYVPRELPPMDYHAMINELHGIAILMRQIVDCANATKHINAVEYEKNLKALLNAILRIQAGMVLPDKVVNK